MATKQNYYFFTAKTFTEQLHESDEQAIAAAGEVKDCVRVMRASDSQDIWTKPVEQPAEN